MSCHKTGVILLRNFLSAVIGTILVSGITIAEAATPKVPSVTEIPVLKANPQQDTSCSRVGGYFMRSHYKEVNIDDAFISEVYKMYFDKVDHYRTLFTEGELENFKKDSKKMREALDSCRLAYPYELYQKVLNRRFEKYSYFLNVLDTDFDFSGHEEMVLDSSKAPYAKTQEQLKQYWKLLVANDVLSQTLNGTDIKKVKENLKKRYINTLRNIVKTKDEDAFSVFENAFASAIDPHTSYLSPDDSTNFDNEMNLEMEGIGAVLSQKDDYCEIVSLVPGSPADKVGKLRPKDKIIGVQQHKKGESNEMIDIVGMRLIEVVPMVKGSKGSKVTLQIMRGEGNIFNVDIVRDKVHLEDSAAKGTMKIVDGHKVGVLTVKSFYMNLSKDMDKEIQKMKKEGIEALVVDLRDNGGGALSEAINSSGLFFKTGPVVQVRDAIGNVSASSDTVNSSSYDGPLVVMINRLSASSSEIFAAALQDYGRALIVGDTSFGKGTVQQSRPLDRIYDFYDSPLGSIHYTIAKFYRINGGSTQIRGVTPDIKFPTLIDHNEIGEGNEPNALPWDQVRKADYKVFTDFSKYLPELTKKHQERIKIDPDFQDIDVLIKDYKKESEKNTISLNFDERKAKMDESEARSLVSVNRFLKAQGKPEVKKIKDLPNDFKGRDTFLDEAVNIAWNLAQQLRNDAK